jgi:putative addiction module killer protein
VEIEYTNEREFVKWLRAIGNPADSRVMRGLSRTAELHGSRTGLPTVRSLGGLLFEYRVNKYRVYFTETARTMTILASGDKDTQDRDIARARRRMP